MTKISLEKNYLNNKKIKAKLFNHKFLHVANKLIFGLIIILSISYILSINDLSIKGFVINDLKSRMNELTKENESYDLRIAQLEANDNINVRAEQLAMVKVDKINYINIIDEKVAKR